MVDLRSDQQPPQDHRPRKWLFSRSFIIAICAVLILGFLIYTGHGLHVLGYAPFLILLACPFMHFFMHGSHHGHGHPKDDGHA